MRGNFWCREFWGSIFDPILSSPSLIYEHFVGKTCHYSIHWLATHGDNRGQKEFDVLNEHKVNAGNAATN